MFYLCLVCYNLSQLLINSTEFIWYILTSFNNLNSFILYLIIILMFWSENLREKIILSDNAFASSISVPKIYLSDEVGVLQSLFTVTILFWRTLMSKNLWRKCLHHRISARVKWTKYGCTLLTLHLLLFI